MDAVVTASYKQQIKPITNEYELLDLEQNYCDFELLNTCSFSDPQVDDELQQNKSQFDVYDMTIYDFLATNKSRQYAQRAFQSYLKVEKITRFTQSNFESENYTNPGRQTPRSVMLRKSDFSELVRMFMKDCQ